MNQVELAMQLIVHAGNAKSKVMEAMAFARKNEFAQAQERLQQCNDAMTEAHKYQTDILQNSLENPDEGVIMLMAHAQDHMMNAIIAYDFGVEICALYQRLEAQP